MEESVRKGDVVTIPAGHGSMSGKVGQVIRRAIDWCDVAVPIGTVGVSTIHTMVRVELAAFWPRKGT